MGSQSGKVVDQELGKFVRYYLTDRQIEIMDLMVTKEMTVAEIAKHLHISKRTVQFHMDRVKETYEVESALVACLRYMKECYKIRAILRKRNQTGLQAKTSTFTTE